MDEPRFERKADEAEGTLDVVGKCGMERGGGFHHQRTNVLRAGCEHPAVDWTDLGLNLCQHRFGGGFVGQVARVAGIERIERLFSAGYQDEFSAFLGKAVGTALSQARGGSCDQDFHKALSGQTIALVIQSAGIPR